MKILKLFICLAIVAMALSCENKKTREEIEADFKDIDRTEQAEEEIMTYEQQEASLRENTDAFKTKMPTEEEEAKKKEAEQKEKKDKKQAETESSGVEGEETATDGTTEATASQADEPATSAEQSARTDAVIDGMAQ